MHYGKSWPILGPSTTLEVRVRAERVQGQQEETGTGSLAVPAETGVRRAPAIRAGGGVADTGASCPLCEPPGEQGRSRKRGSVVSEWLTQSSFRRGRVLPSISTVRKE